MQTFYNAFAMSDSSTPEPTKAKEENNDDLLRVDDQVAEYPVETDVDVADIETLTEDIVKKLKKQIKEEKEAKRLALEEVQRIKADFLNNKKRLEQDLEQKLMRNREGFLRSLLPVCDSFQMAMQNSEQWEKVDKVWRSGVEGIYGQLQSVLDEYSVQQISPIGELFDPHLHEAVDEVPATDDVQHNAVARVVQCGYQIQGTNGDMRLLRPARVVVANDKLNNT